MTIEKYAEGKKLTITLTGRLDTTTAPKLETELKQNRNARKAFLFFYIKINFILFLWSEGSRSPPASAVPAHRFPW